MWKAARSRSGMAISVTNHIVEKVAKATFLCIMDAKSISFSVHETVNCQLNITTYHNHMHDSGAHQSHYADTSKIIVA
jgi:hypothetical protein